MKIKMLLILLAGTALISSGCNKELKQTTGKIAEQTQVLTALQEKQAQQISLLQTQLVALGPMLDEMSSARFQKSYADALFFHTNTLFLLLAVDRQIEAELKAAEARQQTEHDLVYSYHTNQLSLLQTNDVQFKEALLAQQSQLQTNINAIGAMLSQQIEALAPDAAEISRRQQIAADLDQIKLDLTQIKARLMTTNSPFAKP
jgi:hypothetical protein